MREAPILPTAEQLEAMHPLLPDTGARVAQQRLRIAQHLVDGFVAGPGGCSTIDARREIIIDEGDLIAKMQTTSPVLSTHERTCLWKPRSNPRDCHGEETVDPTSAHSLITELANRYAHASMEIAFLYHLARYGTRLAFAWTGARNVHETKLLLDLALEDPTLPLGVKNGLDGEIEPALSTIHNINRQRADKMDNPAPAVLIYRGGQKATTPIEWEIQRQKVFYLTEGQFIDDSAHGTSIAHDPNNQKSNYGQEAALDHIVTLSSLGYVSAGLLVEASDVVSATDPNLPFNTGMEAISELARYKEGI